MQTRQFNCWALIEPSEELKDRWVAHCLDVDVVSYGDSPKHAFEMVCEATVMVILDDLNDGQEPLLRRAPEELWEPLWAVANNGDQVELDSWNDARAGGNEALAVHYVVPCVSVAEEQRAVPKLKLAWCTTIVEPLSAAV